MSDRGPADEAQDRQKRMTKDAADAASRANDLRAASQLARSKADKLKAIPIKTGRKD